MAKPLNLHWEALPARQREVLGACSETSRKWRAYLAGGTALALQLGHRRSEDLDWFTPESVPPDTILGDVAGLGLPMTVDQNDPGTFLGQVGGVKFSVFRYRYPLIGSFVEAEGADLASLPDLAAMKLAALMGRATKRDYVDVHELLAKKRLSLPSMVEAFEAKYQGADVQGALSAVNYFKDVAGDMPIMLKPVTWKKIMADLDRLARQRPGRHG